MLINMNPQQEEPKILSSLKDNGNVNGKKEFLFSISNMGTDEAVIEFLTWLEYNVAIHNLDNKEIASDEVIIEHIDLNEYDSNNDNNGRTLVIPPNQKVDYRLHISNIPRGNYEIIINSASGYGGRQHMEFKVEN